MIIHLTAVTRIIHDVADIAAPITVELITWPVE